MTDEKEKSSKPKLKFTLGSLLHRVQRLSLTADVVIEGTVVPDFKVAWVDLRGSQDPEYLSRSVDYLSEFRDEIADATEEEDEDKRKKLVADATSRFTSLSVACAIEKWDEKFFGKKFDIEYAIEIFQDQKNFLIYNQMANYIQKAVDFLPDASQPQSNG